MALGEGSIGDDISEVPSLLVVAVGAGEFWGGGEDESRLMVSLMGAGSSVVIFIAPRAGRSSVGKLDDSHLCRFMGVVVSFSLRIIAQCGTLLEEVREITRAISRVLVVLLW